MSSMIGGMSLSGFKLFDHKIFNIFWVHDFFVNFFENFTEWSYMIAIWYINSLNTYSLAKSGINSLNSGFERLNQGLIR